MNDKLLEDITRRALERTRVVESDESPKDPYEHWGSHAHKRQASFHRSQARKHAWDSETGRAHKAAESMHLSKAYTKRDKEQAAARADKKANGASRARYQTGHEVVRNQKYGTVSKHTADHFHVKWNHDGSETKHRQSDGAAYGSGSSRGFWGRAQGAVSHLPGKGQWGGGERMTSAEHQAAERDRQHKKKQDDTRAERVRRAQSGLSSLAALDE